MAHRLGRESTDAWRHHAQRWVDVGIVTTDQAHSSVEREGTGARVHLDGATVRTGRALSPITEVASYVGVIVSGAASVALIGHSWSGLSEAARVSIGVLVALAGLLGGEFVSRIEGAGAKRLGGLLWLCGTVGAAQAVAEVVQITGVRRRRSRSCSLVSR